MVKVPMHRTCCEAFPDFNIKFVPPFSQFFNPNGKCFSLFKSSPKHYIGNEVDRCTTERTSQRGTTVCAPRQTVLAAAVKLKVPNITPQPVAQTYNHANTPSLAACSAKKNSIEVLYLKARGGEAEVLEEEARLIC